jgi:biotin transport system substrate-specific component
MLLEPKYAFFSTLAYILLGAFGLPVFAGFKGGIHVLFGMTGGFIMAYPIMAFITALSYQLSKKVKSSSFTRNLSRIAIPAFGMLVSLFMCYLIGTLWFSYVSGSTIAYSLSVCVFPFIAFDLLKIALAISFGLVLRKVIDRIS